MNCEFVDTVDQGEVFICYFLFGEKESKTEFYLKINVEIKNKKPHISVRFFMYNSKDLNFYNNWKYHGSTLCFSKQK